MAYSLYTDVVNEFKNIDITNGVITETKINEFISQADAYIDGRIGLIYQTPVTGTNSLLILKKISIGLTAQRIANILELKSVVAEGDQAIPKDLIAEAKEDLQLIVDRGLLLSDADEVTTTGGVSSYTGENTVERTFQQGTQQW